MGRCDGFCRTAMNAEEYNRRIDMAVQLLEGKIRAVTEQLAGEMEQAAEDLRFEEADVYKRQPSQRPGAARRRPRPWGRWSWIGNWTPCWETVSLSAGR